MLIPFPFAFLSGGWAFGIAAALRTSRDLDTVARYLVPTGLAAGLAAAVPGIIDYAYTVPPDSSAKERATSNQIGVDHRYANAGKWREDTREHSGSRALVSAAAAAQLEVNQMKLVHADGERVVVGRTETGYAAFSDRCTHRGGPLSDGALICGTVQCPWHGSQFDVHTGEVKCGPAEQKIKTYEMEPLHKPARPA
jgi:nitrite reductase/ring-hydroxylating ferredoxin subunit